MKRAIPAVLILTLALSTMGAPEAGAGWLDKWKNKDKETENKAAPRYDLFPTMSFHKGVLGRGPGLGWQLDEMDLQFRPDCVVTSELNGEPELSEGREVIVVGPRLGKTIIAYRVRFIKPDYMSLGISGSAEVIPSEVDPTVGVGTGPE